MKEFKKSWMCMAMLLPSAAFGQFFNGTGVDSPNSTKPWVDFKLNPKTKIKLDFRDASVDNVLAIYEKASGVTIVKDPALIGKVTITSAKPVSLNDAFAILKANLDLKGYDLNKDGSFLIIKNRNNTGGGNGFGGRNFSFTDPGGGFGDDPNSRIGVKVYKCDYANASQLAKVVNDVYSGTGTTQNNPFGGGFGNRGGGPGGFGGGPNRFGGGGGFGGQNNRMGGFMGMFGAAGSTSPVKASSDDYTNSVIVSANDRDQAQVGNLVHQLDKNSDEPMKPHVFHLKYASCNDVQPVVLNVLQTNAPKGKAGMGPQTLQSTFQNALRIGTGQAASGPVVSDLRTNSIVVTTTPANLEIASKLIDQLDKPVDFQSTTFVYPLTNARPDMVANLFLQAFGQRQGTQATNSTRNPFSTPNTNANGNVTSGNTSTAGRPAGANVGPGEDLYANSLPIQLQDPNSTSGDLLTSTSVAVQGFGFGGGGQRPGGGGGGASQSTQTSVTQTRDPNGQITNLRDLTGQISVIPDMNTGSLIVVTTPDNRDLVKSILATLDQVAQQVMIQTIIVEASLTKANQFGLEWQYVTTKNGAKSTFGDGFGLQNASPALQGFSYTLAGSDLTGFFNMLQSDTKFQILSTPRIYTSNNSTASINISQSIPYIVSTIQNTNGTTSFNYAFQDVGIVLTVTPRITANGYVNMDVTQTANDLQGYTSFNAPIVNQREANTTVTVKDGETVVLGGMIQNQVSATVNKIPLLGDIPVLGSLFQSKNRTDTKTELLVFLTPTVIRDVAEAKKLYQQTKAEMSRDTKESMSIIQSPASSAATPKKNGGQ